MTQQRAGQNEFDSTGFILFLYHWRRVLLIALVAAVLGSVIFSSPFFITPKFRSTVVMFPVSTNSISKALLSENYGGKTDILEFGEEEQAEQMLQILNSNKIRNRIIDAYDLMSHYGIDTSSRYKYTRLYREYDRNISFRRTEYMAVEISVLDRDAVVAAHIANHIAALLDSTKNSMQQERAEKAFRIVEAEYLELRRQVQEMEDSLTFLRQMGVHDYESQSEMINQQLAIEVARGNQVAIRALEEKLDMLATYGGPYVSLRDALEHEKKQLSLIKAKYEEAKVDAEQDLPQKFVVNTAYPAERKAYPIRWLIVAVTTVLVLILTMLLLILIDSIRGREWKKKRVTIPERNQVREAPEVRTHDPPVPKSVAREAEIGNRQETRAQTFTETNQPQEKEQPDQPSETTQGPLMNHYADNMSLLQMLIKWRRPLMIIGLAAAVLGVIVSSPFVIKPKFRSYAVLYPSNIWPYSDESESEQMLQLLNSTQIRDSLIGKFDLATHYGIEPEEKYFQSTLYYMYSRNVKISKKEFEAVEVEVMDADPRIACDMVEHLITTFNKMVNQRHHEKFKEVMRNYEEVLSAKKAHIDSLRSRLYVLNSRYGLLDYESQSREITEGYLGTLDGPGNRLNMPAVMEMKRHIEDKGAELLMLQEMIRAEADGYAEFKLDYDKALLDVNRQYTHATVVSPPYPADKKAYPVRWLIVVMTTLASLFVASLVIALVENKKLKQIRF